MPRERQPEPWRSTAWATAYFRRVGVESLNAELKTHRMDLRRGFTRVFGAIKNTLLLAFAFAATNIRILREWHAKRDLPDPWASALHEPAAPHGPRRRKARRTRTYTDLGVPPPDPDRPAAAGRQ